MLLKLNNHSLVDENPSTVLTTAVSAGGTTLAVRDNTGFSNQSYIIIGEIGEEGTELKQINAVVTAGTSLTITATTFAHSVDTPIYLINFNRAEFSRATTITGTKTILTATSNTPITPDQEFTSYNDGTNTTGFGFGRWYNSTANAFSPYSSGVNYEPTGDYSSYDAQTLFRMQKKVRMLLNEDNPDSKLNDDQIQDFLNDKQRDIAHQELWKFYEGERSDISIADQFQYSVPSEFQKVYQITYRTQPIININHPRWKLLHWDTDVSSDTVTHASIWDNKIWLYPTPASAAANNQLDGGITSGDSTITVDSTASWTKGDFYRIKIDSEIIYATGKTATTFTNCLRGQENTTAASHSDNSTVYDMDIVVSGHLEPVDMFYATDRTRIEDPEVLVLGAAADLALFLEKEPLHDRLTIRYDKAYKKLKEKYGMKFTSQFGCVKDSRSQVRDNYLGMNQNNFPKSVN